MFCSFHLYVKDSGLFSQLSKLEVPSVVPIGRQEVEPVNVRRAARVVSVSQVPLVHVGLGERQRRGHQDSSQQQSAVAWQLCNDVAQVGGGGVGVGELQVVRGDGLRGPVLQPEARVVVQGRRDAVAPFDGEVKGPAAGRVAVGDVKTVKTKTVWLEADWRSHQLLISYYEHVRASLRTFVRQEASAKT